MSKDKFNKSKKIAISTHTNKGKSQSDLLFRAFYIISAFTCMKKFLHADALIDKLKDSDELTPITTILPKNDEDSDATISENRIKYKENTIVLSYVNVDLSRDQSWARQLIIIQKDHQDVHLPTNVFFTKGDIKTFCETLENRTPLARLFLDKTNLWQFCTFAQEICPQLINDPAFIKKQVDYICEEFSEQDIHLMKFVAEQGYKLAMGSYRSEMKLHELRLKMLHRYPANIPKKPDRALLEKITSGVNERISELKAVEKKIMGWTP